MKTEHCPEMSSPTLLMSRISWGKGRKGEGEHCKGSLLSLTQGLPNMCGVRCCVYSLCCVNVLCMISGKGRHCSSLSCIDDLNLKTTTKHDSINLYCYYFCNVVVITVNIIFFLFIDY